MSGTVFGPDRDLNPLGYERKTWIKYETI